MVSEEIELNHALEKHNINVVETDLGEYIVQLRKEKPSHIITPAAHLKKEQVAQLFHDRLGIPYTEDIPTLTATARKVLREVFLTADIGLSGVNFGVAETGGMCIVTIEGNGRMVTTIPKTHIALMGMERLVPNLDDLALMLSLLPRSATGQKLTVYTQLLHKPMPGQTRHLIVLDNGRTRLRNSALKESLYCIRCAGYRLENISVFPPVVTVFASDPQLIKYIPGVVETQPLDIQDAKDDIITRLGLSLPANITIVGAQTVQVEVGISPIQTSLTLSNQQISITGLPEGMIAQISPQTVDIILSGPLPVLDILTPQDITITVDVTGLDIGAHQLTPKVNTLVDNVLVESMFPGTIEVVVILARHTNNNANTVMGNHHCLEVSHEHHAGPLDQHQIVNLQSNIGTCKCPNQLLLLLAGPT